MLLSLWSCESPAVRPFPIQICTWRWHSGPILTSPQIPSARVNCGTGTCKPLLGLPLTARAQQQLQQHILLPTPYMTLVPLHVAQDNTPSLVSPNLPLQAKQQLEMWTQLRAQLPQVLSCYQSGCLLLVCFMFCCKVDCPYCYHEKELFSILFHIYSILVWSVCQHSTKNLSYLLINKSTVNTCLFVKENKLHNDL